jgi:hypothetical protein
MALTSDTRFTFPFFNWHAAAVRGVTFNLWKMIIRAVDHVYFFDSVSLNTALSFENTLMDSAQIRSSQKSTHEKQIIVIIAP